MKNFIERVISVRDWAHVEVKYGMVPYAKQTLTLRPDNGGVGSKPNKPLHQYRVNGDNGELYIPRAIIGGRMRVPLDREWTRLKCETKIKEYRVGQLETITKFIEGLENVSAYGGILRAVTGAGKTVMGIDIAVKLGLKTLIVVPRSSLLQQWIDRIKQYTNCTDKDIGVIKGPKCDYEGKQFVVGMIHTMAQRANKFPAPLYDTFGTVIFDEVHVVGAETFSKVCPLYYSKYRIGLSATLRRGDGMEPVFWWHIGPVLSEFKRLQAEPRIRIIPYRGIDTNHAGCVWGGNLNLGRYFNRVAKSRERLELVRKIVLKLSQNEHDVLVLSDRINLLERLKAALVESGVEEQKIGMLIGNKKQLDRKIILGTYGSAGMGVDIPRLSALVMATPRAEIEQAVGRVLRKGSPIVVDIVDTASNIMRKWGWKRKKFYYKISKDVVDKT